MEKNVGKSIKSAMEFWGSIMTDSEKPFKTPKPLEYAEHLRAGFGTESAAPFLRALVQMVRPQRILEIGAGYTTPFLLEAIVNNERVFDDGNLNHDYLARYVYDPKLVVIDDMSLGDISKKLGMESLMKSQYIDFLYPRYWTSLIDIDI